MGPDRPAAHQRGSERPGQGVRHPHSGAGSQGGHPVRRERAEAPAGPGALLRPEGRGLPQAHLWPGPQDDRAHPRGHPRPGGEGRGGGRHLHGPRRADRAVRSHRGAVPRAPGGHREQRASCGRPGRLAHDRDDGGGLNERGPQVPRGRGRGHAVDAGARRAEGVVRDQRDHHHADDVVHRGGSREHLGEGAVPGSRREHPADQDDPVRQAAPQPVGHPGSRRSPARARRGSRRPLPADQDIVRAAASGSRGEPAYRQARRHQRAAGDRHQLRVERLPHRRGRGRGRSRPVGVRPRQLEPGLRRHRHPLRLPGAAQPARGRPVRRLLRGALDRRRPRRPAGEPAHRLPPRAGGAHPAVHDRDRVPGTPKGPGPELSHAGAEGGASPPAGPEASGTVNGLLTQSFMTALVAGGIVAAVPLMFTALGESVSERAGVLNIGLEGMMLLGAYLGFLGAYELHSEWLGFGAGIAGGLAGAIVMALLSVTMGLDQIVVGIAITLAGEGITSVLQQAQFKGRFPGLGNPATVAIPGLSRIPVLGHSLFDQPLLVYLGIGLLALVAWVFRATSWGLNLRAAGEKPEALDAAGVSVLAVRTYAVLTTGALAGLGGAYLAIVGANTFTPFMTQGQGFIAIVIAMLARGKPLWVGVSSFVFGICLSIGTALQLTSINISSDVINMLPYIAIMAALILFARGSYLPPALSLPYIRGGK